MVVEASLLVRGDGLLMSNARQACSFLMGEDAGLCDISSDVIVRFEFVKAVLATCFLCHGMIRTSKSQPPRSLMRTQEVFDVKTPDSEHR